jgi:spore cortex formation protein SpoVR/YcgB (stage V sporulation)
MMDCYSSTGMPVFYPHWSFGKQFLTVEKSYRRGYMGLAYELVINSNPCIAYLMEENSMTMQALVIAHACYGHNSFFKNNYLFKTWTNADAIIDYLVFARNYIAECEERYGVSAVEELLDSCHALMNYGVDRYRRPPALSITEEKHRQKEREEYLQSQINDLWLRTVPKKERYFQEQAHQFPAEPEENLLYFFEKNAPLLESWQREIIRIVRKIAQYLYPQRQTKVMNEGWATFWHYTLLNRLYDEGLVTDGFMLEFLQSHTNVISQPPYYSNHFSGLNPYALGFAMMNDIRRICEHPADEDRKWFPDLVDTDWTKTLDFAMRNFKDESFIAQYLSPKVIRDFKLFSVLDDDLNDELEITHIHDEDGYRAVRHVLSDQYNLGNLEPSIQVYRVDTRGDRSLTLRHYQHHRRPLGESTNEMLRHVRRLWGFKARLETVDENGRIQKSYECD